MRNLFIIVVCLLLCGFISSGTGTRFGIQPNVSLTTDYSKDPNCMGAWRLNGANGASEIDRTSNGNTLALTGTMDSTTTVPTGYSGKSRNTTSATSNKLACNDGSSLDINGAAAKVSIVAWINPNAVTGFTCITGKYGSSNAQYDLIIFNSKAYFRVSANGTAQTEVATTSNISISTWTHLSCVYDGVNITIYVNGVIGSTPVAYSSGLFNGTGQFIIGAFPGDNGMYGYTDEVGIFNKALSTTEITSIYTNGLFGDRGIND